MRRKSIFTIFFLLGTLLACHNTSSEIGAGLVSGQGFDVSFIDTVALTTSMMKFDSLVSSNAGHFLVGYHVDEKLGPVNVKTIFQISPPSSVTLSPLTTHYVGLALHMFRDRYFYYDTSQMQTMYVYRVMNKQQLYNGALYNVDNFKVDNTPLGTYNFFPRPNLLDSIEIPLSDDLGQQWMTMAQQGDPNLIPANFVNLFYGLALIPDSTQSGSFLGFTTKGGAAIPGNIPAKKTAPPTVRLYYTDDATPAGQNPLKWISFVIGGNQFYWSSFHSDRSATKLASLKVSTDVVPSSETNHELYVQGGTGISARIEMPNLRNLTLIQSNFQCTRAVLTITPIQNSNDPQNPLPATLTLDLVNSQNQGLSSGYLSSSLFTDLYGKASYTVDVTNFVNGEITTTDNNVHNALLVRLSNTDENSKVNRLYFGDQRNYDYGLKMKVYYITLTDQ